MMGWNDPKVKSSDKASQARIKQAGAESIGRYYSSSDGKYYKDYNAAKRAKDIRISQQQKKSAPNITPIPKSKSHSSASYQRRKTNKGSSATPAKPKTPNFGASSPKGGNQKRKILGIF